MSGIRQPQRRRLTRRIAKTEEAIFPALQRRLPRDFALLYPTFPASSTIFRGQKSQIERANSSDFRIRCVTIGRCRLSAKKAT